jgi:hypothetical protein
MSITHYFLKCFPEIRYNVHCAHKKQAFNEGKDAINWFCVTEMPRFKICLCSHQVIAFHYSDVVLFRLWVLLVTVLVAL